MNHFISEVPVFERISRFSRVFLKKTAVSRQSGVNEKTRVSWRKNARLFIYCSSFNGNRDFYSGETSAAGAETAESADSESFRRK